MKVVGKYIEEFNTITGQNIPCGDIYQSDGLSVHVQKRHPDCMSDLPSVPAIIACPDYIGHNPKEPSSLELVKRINGNVMVCVKLDISGNYLYVASVFKISDGKLHNRLESGRLIKCIDI